MSRSPPDRDDDRPRDREELAAQLDELESTLNELRSELRSDRRRGPPKPPSLGELLRFTEQYSIPTLIALLEATIQSLELLRRTLRLADPGRAARAEGDAARTQLDRVGNEAGEQLANALGELRTALSTTELPENTESRRLLEDAYGLTDDIEQRLRDAEAVVREQRDRERRDDSRDADPNRSDRDSPDRDRPGRSRGVMIDVTEDDAFGPADNSERDETEADTDEPSTDENGRDDPAPDVDVDAELESIKNELDRSNAAADDHEKSKDEPNREGDTPPESDTEVNERGAGDEKNTGAADDDEADSAV